ncbi:reverse transcriptase SR3-right, putative [Ixodes scapularis]|uniref:Reverse transcriptase SR3-right, putative n=1 Tax=Ixodes scapularis TaxID=6945 RepID=B7PXF8_IXOSC|nr:reverse transcriptase SR3-right, putative [Ixodes scapularis]|eukprot:XP_002400470.1 reverse transcriptase SR3-right, putative [Ixodes scapularis]
MAMVGRQTTEIEVLKAKLEERGKVSSHADALMGRVEEGTAPLPAAQPASHTANHLKLLCTAIEEHPSTKEVLRKPNKRNPQFRVSGVDPDILPAELLTTVNTHNEGLEIQPQDFHHRTMFKEKSGNVTHIFEVTAAVYPKIKEKSRLRLGWTMCAVNENFYVPRCDKCSPPASPWRGARTTFMPKKNPAQDPSDFRPIAVGPVVRKLFHQILAKRARAAAALDFRERAFQPMNECAENILLLSTALKEARQKLRLLYLASIDMAKAFDRVSTEAILRGALWNQFDDSFMAYLKELYSTSHTTLQFEREDLRVQPTTGVRQGDSRSPILFKMVVDELLCSVDPNITVRSDGFALDTMAFADYLVVLASTPQSLQQRLDDLAVFLEPRGLAIHVNKSFTLALQPSGRDKKIKVLTTTDFTINGQPLPASGVATTWRYLGVNFAPEGTKTLGIEEELEGLLEKLRRAPLKPQKRRGVANLPPAPSLSSPHSRTLVPWSPQKA